MILRLVVTLFLFSSVVFSQEKFIKHTISKGDNISVIAKKYGVKTKAIFDANPNAPKILKLNSVLLIPNKNFTSIKTPVEAVVINNPGSHQVLAKETLWGISKKYNVAVDDLKKANPLLETEGLKIGQQLIIPSSEVASLEKPAQNTEIQNTENSSLVEVEREVLPKETKYAIAKEFGISVAELHKQNPQIKTKLRVGSVLKIKTTKEKADAYLALKPQKKIEEAIVEVPSQFTNGSSEVAEVAEDSSSLIKVENHLGLIDQLISTATENIGIRYRSGGTTKAGFDCSGLMYSTFSNFDVKLPRTSIEQSRIGIKVNSDEAQKGDLIFFKTNGRRHINHVGMVVDVADGEIKFVHSSTHGGVIISSTKESYYGRNFSQVNRVLQ